jgi:glycosyltransferase involved in cell wall biosynthesis
MTRINLIAWDNSRGLGHDVCLLVDTLTALGHSVEVTRLGRRRHDGQWRAAWLRLKMLWHRLSRLDRKFTLYDLNIALEHVRPPFMALARRNVLVPNPEWLTPRGQRYLPRFDAVLCKTRHATDLFAARGCKALHIGFDSPDCLRRGIAREQGFLHLAGASPFKGTERLLELWLRHPEWPKLVVLQSPASGRETAVSAKNIDHRLGRVSVEEIRLLQNRYTHHLCLSETEGWGHYLVEAMSCGAVVITTDAPPMNELVDPTRGVLVRTTEGRAFNMAQLYAFDEAALEATIERVVAMSEAERQRIGERARAWFDENHCSFAAQLDAALRKLLDAPAHDDAQIPRR